MHIFEFLMQRRKSITIDSDFVNIISQAQNLIDPYLTPSRSGGQLKVMETLGLARYVFIPENYNT